MGGKIPSELGLLTALEKLSLNKNELTGIEYRPIIIGQYNIFNIIVAQLQQVQSCPNQNPKGNIVCEMRSQQGTLEAVEADCHLIWYYK